MVVTAGLLLQVVVTGLATGAAYGLVAAGFVLVFRLTGILHFAHGDVLGASLFIGLLVAGSGNYPGVAAIAFVVAAAGSALLYLVVLRPAFRRRAELGWIGGAVAAAFAIDATLVAAFPRAAYVFPDLAAFDRFRTWQLGGGASLPARTVFVLGAGLAVAGLADLLLTRSRFGLGLRAVADDPTAAALSGIRVDRVVAGAFAVAGVLAVVAGLVVVPATTLAPHTGLLLGLKGIVAALLAGLVSPRRAFVAGLVVGVFEGVVVVTLHLPAWRDVAPLLAVVVFLAVRPPALAREAVE